MDPKRITAVIVAAILGVILLVTVVAPIVSDGQTTTGDPITKSNRIYTGYYVEPNAEYELTLNASGWTANDVVLTNQNYRQLVFADTFVLQVNTNTDTTSFGYIMDDTLSNPKYLYIADSAEYVVTFNNNTVTITKTGTTEAFYTKEYGWAFAACGAEVDNAWGTITRVGTNDAYILNDSQFYLSGYYYTGENDTFYSYHLGQMESGAYEGSVTFEKEIVSGTTDIYNITELNVAIGEESFNPYLILVPLSVTGHATSGSLYSMLGIIPIVVAIGIVLGVVSMAIVNRYD